MDELIPEKKWWKFSWLWFLPLTIFLLAGMMVFILSSDRSQKKEERAHGIAFDKVKWSVKEGDNYPYRNSMIGTMTSKENLPAWKKMSKQELFETLGQPDRINGNYLYYKANGDKIGFVTFRTIALVIQVNDSTENIIRIYE